jgi:hypothetical protein
MKITPVTTWCGALTLTGAGVVLVPHAAGVIATPGDTVVVSADRPHYQAALRPIEITSKALPSDVQTVEVIPTATATVAAPASRSDEQGHTQSAQADRGPAQTHGFRHRPLRDPGDRHINVTRSHDVGTWLFPPSQGGGQN